MCAPSTARISSSSFCCKAMPSLVCVFWIKNTIRNVMIGRAGIYDQLPGVAEAEYRAGNSPNYDDKHGGSKAGRVSCGARGPPSRRMMTISLLTGERAQEGYSPKRGSLPCSPKGVGFSFSIFSC